MTHEWDLHSFVVNPMHAFGRSSWEGWNQDYCKIHVPPGLRTVPSNCAAMMEKRLYKPGGNEARSSSQTKLSLPAIFSLLFCWVFLWTVAWWTKSSLRFAFLPHELPRDPISELRKKNAKNKPNWVEGKSTRKSLIINFRSWPSYQSTFWGFLRYFFNFYLFMSFVSCFCLSFFFWGCKCPKIFTFFQRRIFLK